jgi:hypothetical protein
VVVGAHNRQIGIKRACRCSFGYIARAQWTPNMSHHEKVLMIAVLLLAHGAAVEADPVTVTNASDVAIFGNGTDTFSFAPITSADELISISSGFISSPEGATLTLDVDYLIGAPQRILTTNLSPSALFNFSGLPPLPFGTGTIDGLTFGFTSTYGIGSLSIPRGTRFTFDAQPVVGSVPEPSSIALVVAGAAGLLNWRRRRTGPASQVATSE